MMVGENIRAASVLVPLFSFWIRLLRNVHFPQIILNRHIGCISLTTYTSFSVLGEELEGPRHTEAFCSCVSERSWFGWSRLEPFDSTHLALWQSVRCPLQYRSNIDDGIDRPIEWCDHTRASSTNETATAKARKQSTQEETRNQCEQHTEEL